MSWASWPQLAAQSQQPTRKRPIVARELRKHRIPIEITSRSPVEAWTTYAQLPSTCPKLSTSCIGIFPQTPTFRPSRQAPQLAAAPFDGAVSSAPPLASAPADGAGLLVVAPICRSQFSKWPFASFFFLLWSFSQKLKTSAVRG